MLKLVAEQNVMRYTIFWPVPVIVSFDQPSFNFSEDSGLVEVCVVADFSNITDTVSVNVSEISGSAQGEKLCFIADWLRVLISKCNGTVKCS